METQLVTSEVDTFTNKNQEFLVAVSAANEGYGDAAHTYRGPQVGSIAIAKNALTVSATLSARSDGNNAYIVGISDLAAFAGNAIAVANMQRNILTVSSFR